MLSYFNFLHIFSLSSVAKQLLGKGSFGSVYLVRRMSDRSLHVMKKISIHDMPPKERKATEQECKVLQRLRHPGNGSHWSEKPLPVFSPVTRIPLRVSCPKGCSGLAADISAIVQGLSCTRTASFTRIARSGRAPHFHRHQGHCGARTTGWKALGVSLWTRARHRGAVSVCGKRVKTRLCESDNKRGLPFSRPLLPDWGSGGTDREAPEPLFLNPEP